MRSTVSPMLDDMTSKENLTKSAIKEQCEAAGSQETRTEVEAIILSYLYTFLDSSITHLGPGDLAAEDFFNRDDLHERLTKMFNMMTASNLPVSVLTFPQVSNRST